MIFISWSWFEELTARRSDLLSQWRNHCRNIETILLKLKLKSLLQISLFNIESRRWKAISIKKINCSFSFLSFWCRTTLKSRFLLSSIYRINDWEKSKYAKIKTSMSVFLRFFDALTQIFDEHRIRDSLIELFSLRSWFNFVLIAQIVRDFFFVELSLNSWILRSNNDFSMIAYQNTNFV